MGFRLIGVDFDKLPERTLPDSIGCFVQGFSDEAIAQKLGLSVLSYVGEFSKYIDLSTLDGVTIAIDYDAALAGLDRGFDGVRRLARSDNDIIQGVAMTPAVLRDGEVRSHILFNAEVVYNLISDERTDKDIATSMSIVAHECAHVEVTAHKVQKIPEMRPGTHFKGFVASVTWPIVEHLWDEYAACRLASLWAGDDLRIFSDSLTNALSVARERASTAIDQYRFHADVDRLVHEAAEHLGRPVRIASYLLGTMDGLGKSWSEFNGLVDLINEEGFRDYIDNLHKSLLQLWDTQDEWESSRETFSPLQDLVIDLIESQGIFIEPFDDGSAYVHVPF